MAKKTLKLSHLLRILTWPLTLFVRYRLMRRSLKYRSDPNRYSQVERAGYTYRSVSHLLSLNLKRVEVEGLGGRLLKRPLLFLLPTSRPQDLLLGMGLSSRLVYGYDGDRRLASYIYLPKPKPSPYLRCLFNLTDSLPLKEYSKKREAKEAKEAMKRQLLSLKRFTIASLNLPPKELFEVVNLAKDSLVSIVLLEVVEEGGGPLTLSRDRVRLRVVKEFDKDYHLNNKIEDLFLAIKAKERGV